MLRALFAASRGGSCKLRPARPGAVVAAQQWRIGVAEIHNYGAVFLAELQHKGGSGGGGGGGGFSGGDDDDDDDEDGFDADEDQYFSDKARYWALEWAPAAVVVAVAAATDAARRCNTM
jgi:hypothetical protein